MYLQNKKGIDYMTFQEFKNMVLYHTIVEWNDNEIVLDNGIRIRIEETEQECCAGAYGTFSHVKLNAVITNVTERKFEPWEDDDTYGCCATVKFLHNQNLVCEANANADAGNGGYYYSIASFVVDIPKKGQHYTCHFVSNYDE